MSKWSLQEVSKAYVYHVAEEDVRSSIKRHGLDPRRYPDQDNLSTNGSHVYVFQSEDSAKQYADGYQDFLRRQGDEIKSFDIWQVDVTGLPISKDLTLYYDGDPDEDDAYMIKGKVSRSRLKLIRTV